MWWLSNYSTGFSVSETAIIFIQQQFDSSACWCFPKLSKWPFLSMWPAPSTNINLIFLFIILYAALNPDCLDSISSDSSDWPKPKLQFQWCCDHYIPAGNAAGKQTDQLSPSSDVPLHSDGTNTFNYLKLFVVLVLGNCMPRLSCCYFRPLRFLMFSDNLDILH